MSLLSNYRNPVPVSTLPQDLQGQMQIINGQLVSMVDNGVTYIKEGFNINDIVYSIINMQTEKIKTAPWGLYEVIDESSLKHRNSLLQNKGGVNAKKVLELTKKSLNPVLPAKGGKWSDLLRYPNETQTFPDFISYGCGYKMLNGNKYIWADILADGKNQGKPNSLWVMPSQYVTIYADRTQKWPVKVMGYALSIFPTQNFKEQEIMHEKTENYDCDTSGNFLYGISPLKPMLMRINQSNSLLKTNTAKVQNGGVEALIFAKNQPGQPTKESFTAMQDIKGKLIHEYTGSDNWGKIVASNIELGVEKLGMSPVELDIYQAQLSDMRFMCNIYGVPSQLMNDPQNRSHNTAAEAEKALTNRCVIPQLIAARDNINRWAHKNGGLPGNWIIDFDISAYPELQDDMTKTATWVAQTASFAGYSMNEVRGFMGVETIDLPEYNDPRIFTNSGETVTEHSANIVDQTLNGASPVA